MAPADPPGAGVAEAAGDRTRLIVSGYADARPRLLQAVQNVLFWEPSHWIMQTRQFANLKRRAETLARTVTY